MGLTLRLVLLAIFLAPCAHGRPPQEAPQPPVTVTVQVTERVLNTVRREIFGDNIEWVHNGMGFWDPDRKRLDERLVSLLREAGVTHLRYPGGTLSDYFDWSQAVGERRTPQPNPFDEGRPQYPSFGPEEFMALCRRLGIRGYITLNAGTGSPELAAAWVRHLREKRFPVQAFEVGNEIYMADAAKEQVPALPVAKTARQYADFFLKTRDAVDRAVPGVRFGAIGLVDTGAFALSKHPDWVRDVLREIGGRVDFLAIHNGYAPAVRFNGFGPAMRRISDDDFARAFLGASVYVAQNLEATKRVMAEAAPAHWRKIDLHITEHGPLVYPFDPAHAREDAVWNRSLAGALYLACLYNVMLREPKVTTANHLPLCQDVYGALIGLRGTGPGRKVWKNIVFHVFRLYADLIGRQTLETLVDGPTYSTLQAGLVPEIDKVPLVDAAAYRARDGRSLRVILINREIRGPVQGRIQQPSGFTVSTVTRLSAASYLAENTPERPETVVPVTSRVASKANPVQLTLPPHSLTVVEFSRAGSGQ